MKKKRLLKYFLLMLILMPLLLVVSLLTPGVQKYLLENQLHPWVDSIQVQAIHITPFAIKIKQLHLNYQGIKLHIGHLDTEFSPLELLSQRIKINKFILKDSAINDQSIAPPEPENTLKSDFLFHGLFPYLNLGYIFDIGQLDIQTEYRSAATGKVALKAWAENISEQQNQPLNIVIDAPELKDIPDIKKINLNAAIYLNQHLIQAINRQTTHMDLQLETDTGLQQSVNLKLAMEQLPKPPVWPSYPFDKQNLHYLTEIYHPEKIALEVRHTENNKLLSHILYNGIYDGNEGIISGELKLVTEKGFLALFKSLELPEIESKLSAQFRYNTHTLDGFVDLKDQFKIRHYLAGSKSLPEQLDINNHLKITLNGDNMKIDRLLLNILSENKEYIKLTTHKPLIVNLSNVHTLLDQQQSDLLTIEINQLPLKWLNDFLPEQKILQGLIDTDINLSVNQRALLLETRRPLSIQNVTMIQDSPAPHSESEAEQITDSKLTAQPQDNSLSQKSEAKKVVNNTINILIENQFVETDFSINISDHDLSATLKRLDIFQKQPDKPEKTKQQLSTSLQFHLNAPVSAEFLNQPLSLSGNGHIDINELIKIPSLKQSLAQLFAEPLSDSLPSQLKLDYQLGLEANNKLWTLKTLKLALNAHKHSNIITLKNLQNIQIKQYQNTDDSSPLFEILSKDKLLSLAIKQFDFKWLKAVISQYASPYAISGHLSRMKTTISSTEKNNFDLNIHHLNFANLKLNKDKQVLFDQLKLKFSSLIHYNSEKVTINYPVLTINQGNNLLLSNQGVITVNQLDQTSPRIQVSGKLKTHINHLMKLKLLNQFTHKVIRKPSILNGQYQLSILNQQLKLSQLELAIFHPRSKGRMDIKTHNPIKIALKKGKQDFSQNGQLSIKLTNFDIAPYEVLFPELPISFKTVNAQINLTQKNKKQTLYFKQPLTISNIHYKNPEKAVLEPFNLVLNAQVIQSGKKTHANIKQLSVQFMDQKNKALDLTADFQLNSAYAMPLKDLNARLRVPLTQWLSQPGIMPKNTLDKGELNAEITMNSSGILLHNWQIDDLTDLQGQQIIKSIRIDGTGKIKTLNNLLLDFPLVMQSQSGTTKLTLKNHIQINNNKPSIKLDLKGQEIFLNDLLKLLATINPESELSKLEQEKELEEANIDSSQKTEQQKVVMYNTPAKAPFWPTGVDILANLDIDTLYYSDYMSYHDIQGKLKMNKQRLLADGFLIRFHDSPMTLNADFKFIPGRKQPYDILLTSGLRHFDVGGFLKELKPGHIPRADGVFDVNMKFYGPLSNLSQIRNELMFNIDISGVDGVYHLISPDDVLVRSSGYAMAVVGEVVSVLPTSGFGLGIINRLVRFIKDINYDLIRLSMSRQADLDTKIDIFEILSPELHLIADGQITFKPNTPVMEQELKMQAHLNLSGEGAAIFYGLGLLNDEQDQYHFWKGPVIKFWGSILDNQNNLEEIINRAREGTLAGGITNPFSGLVGNFKFRWTGSEPDYADLLAQYKKTQPASTEKKTDKTKTSR